MSFDEEALKFTSDLHFLHKNIVKYCSKSRPFDDAEKMTEAIIQQINKEVDINDHFFIAGDFQMGNRKRFDELRSGINCKNLYLAIGNHDIVRKMTRGAFKSIKDILEITTNKEGRHIVICHYAMRVWNNSHNGSWMLYGHSHGTLPDDPSLLSFDIGWDVWQRTLSYYDVKEVMAKKMPELQDGHQPGTPYR